MKSRIVSCIVTTFAIVLIIVMALAMLMPIADADIIRIASIDDSYIGKEVTVCGSVVTTSSNIKTSSILIHEPGETSILTVDDGSGTILVSSNPKLFKFHEGERILVTGIYAGGNIIHADSLSSYTARGCKEVTINELEESPEYYYGASVRIKGNVTRIELTSEKTLLAIDDHTGTMDVEYGAEIGDIKIDDEVVVEGKFYRNKIYASTITVERPEQEQELNQTVPNQSVTPAPTPTLEPEPRPAITPSPSPSPPTETPVPMPTKPGKLFYPILITVTMIIFGIFILYKIDEWFKMRRYSK